MKFSAVIIIAAIFLTLVTNAKEPKEASQEATSTVAQEDCSFCGEKSILNYYLQSDNIGLLYLNTLELDEIRLREFELDGKLKDGYMMVGGRAFNEDVSCRTNVVPDRRYATLDIKITGEAQYADLKKLSEQLCQSCLIKVQNVNEYAEEDERPLSLVIVDLKTEELYPLSANYRSYGIRDYILFIRHEDEKKEVIVFYSPSTMNER